MLKLLATQLSCSTILVDNLIESLSWCLNLYCSYYSYRRRKQKFLPFYLCISKCQVKELLACRICKTQCVFIIYCCQYLYLQDSFLMQPITWFPRRIYHLPFSFSFLFVNALVSRVSQCFILNLGRRVQREKNLKTFSLLFVRIQFSLKAPHSVLCNHIVVCHLPLKTGLQRAMS